MLLKWFSAPAVLTTAVAVLLLTPEPGAAQPHGSRPAFHQHRDFQPPGFHHPRFQRSFFLQENIFFQPGVRPVFQENIFFQRGFRPVFQENVFFRSGVRPTFQENIFVQPGLRSSFFQPGFQQSTFVPGRSPSMSGMR